MKPAPPALIQSLTAMRGAVIDALDTAAAALRAGGLEGYEQAHKQWRNAHAAMQILGHRALIQFSGELGEHVAKQDAASNATNAEQRASSFAGGVQALKAYVDTLSAGRSDQPLTLWPAYEALQLARSVAQPMPSDLFFPDLAQGPGARTRAPQLAADDLRAARRTYEGGLLAWMRKPDDGAALKPLSEVAARVEAAQTDPVMRRPWWALRAVLDALQNNGLESDALVRRVLTQMNLLLGRMINSPNAPVEPPDALTRDALYLAAKAKPVTPLITGVQRVFGLIGMLDMSEPVALAFSAEVASVAAKSVENLHTVWTECAAGNAKCSEFASRAQSLTSQCEKLGVPSLTALTAQLAAGANTLAQRGGPVPDAAALEIACALLLLENVLASANAPLPEFDTRAAHMAMRVGISVESPDALKSMAPAQLIDEESRRKQLAVPLALAYGEITHALHDTEMTLEGWFANPRNPDTVAGLDKPLRQAAGALLVLGHTEAAEIAGACRSDIARYVRGAPCNADEQRGLIKRLAVLSAYVDAAKQGSTQLRQVLERAGVVEIGTHEAEPDVPPMSTMMIELGAEPLAAPALTSPPTLPELLSLDLMPAPAIVADAPPAAPAVAAVSSEAPLDGGGDTDPELLDIFLEEADGVLVTIAETTPKSEARPDDGELLTELRRAYHTLKGSGRMVGLTHFGEAAWEMEQVFNELNNELNNEISAGGVSVQADLYRMVYASHADFARWVAELRSNKSARIDATRLTQWAQRYRAGEALPSDTSDTPDTPDTADKPAESLVQTPAPLPLLEMALEVAEEPSLSMTLDIPAALSIPEVPVPVAIEPPVQMNELNTLTLDFEPTPSMQPDLAPPVPDTVHVGEVSVSRGLYEVMLPEAREHAATLVAQADGMRDQGNISFEVMRAAHTLRGISASAKLPALVALASSLERVLQAGLDSKAPLPAAMRAIAARAAVAVAAQVDDLAVPRAIASHEGLCAELDALHLVAPLEQAHAETATPATEIPELPTPAEQYASEVGLADSEQGDSVNRRQYRLKDDIDAQLLPIFLEEANELVPQVGQDLRDWRVRPADKLVPQSLKRLLHTLKGSARMAGAMALGQLTHSMETRVENAELLAEIPPQLFDGLETSFDRIGVLIAQLQGDDSLSASTLLLAPSAPLADVGAAMTPIELLSPAMEEMARTMHQASATTILAPSLTGEAAHANVVGELESESMTQTVVTDAGAAASTAAPVAGAVVRPLIRVRADLIERLANQAGEISITRSRVAAELRSARNSLRELAENIVRLRGQLRELEIQAETQMQSRQQIVTGGEGEHFDPLEFDRFTRLQELTRMMAESVNDVATVQRNLAHDLDEGDKALASQAQIARDVQQDLMTIRMVQFSTLSDRLYRVARLSARENDKRVELEISGAHVEMDRSVIERVAAPIEHLLRNAIVHGIESPATREASGKPAQGTLKLEARQEGNEVVLTLADDGAGLNIERIREKAIAQGLMRENQRLTEQQIGNFIFRSGFSTASAITADAGRGVGMDVVMSEITALGGRVGTTFKRGAGTTFTVHLPLTLSVLQAVVMRLASNFFAVPGAMVEQVQRLRPEILAAIQQAEHVVWQDKQYPFHPLGKLLNMEADVDIPRYASVLLLRGGTHRVAIQVDDIVGGQEIVIKNAGTQLARVAGVTGAAVLGSGETVLILNPVLLSQRALAEQERVMRELERTQGVPSLRSVQPPKVVEKAVEPERQRSVLVVDDSLTVRKITGRLLTREGYIVLVAKDGIEALEKLREQVPDVMITDVEMPRMDGFDLTRNVRADEALKNVPVIMITSRTADKHREHANELGVDVFLGKPYEEGELLRHIATLSKRPVVV